MNCPNKIDVSPGLIRCSIMPSVVEMVDESKDVCPCHKCKTQWRSGIPPVADDKPEHLIELEQMMAGTYRTPEEIQETEPYPTLREMVGNFTGAMARLINAKWHGKQTLVSQERFLEVLNCCEACTYWDSGARLGFGKCNAPGCGCTSIKLHLATEHCPKGGWDNRDMSKPIKCPSRIP